MIEPLPCPTKGCTGKRLREGHETCARCFCAATPPSRRYGKGKKRPEKVRQSFSRSFIPPRRR